jgi:hypothetical protein
MQPAPTTSTPELRAAIGALYAPETEAQRAAANAYLVAVAETAAVWGPSLELTLSAADREEVLVNIVFAIHMASVGVPRCAARQAHVGLTIQRVFGHARASDRLLSKLSSDRRGCDTRRWATAASRARLSPHDAPPSRRRAVSSGFNFKRRRL